MTLDRDKARKQSRSYSKDSSRSQGSTGKRDRSRSNERNDSKIKGRARSPDKGDSKTTKGAIKSAIVIPSYTIVYLLENKRRRIDKIVEKTGCNLAIEKAVRDCG